MDKPDPIAGVGDFRAAFAILNGLAMFDMLNTLFRLHRQGRMAVLDANFGSARGVNTARLRVALDVVNAKGQSTIEQFAVRAGDAYRGLPADQREDIARFLDPSWVSVVPIEQIPSLTDSELGIEYARGLVTDERRVQAVEAEVERREQDQKGWGTALAPPAAAGTPATTAVSPDVAMKMLENLTSGEPAFKPELGKGGASWFVTEGTPYVGISPEKSINIEVELARTKDAVKFGDAELVSIFEKELATTKVEAEAKFREHYKLPADKPLSSRLRKQFERFHEKFAESRMWDRVGERVASSSSKVGEVTLQNSRFSKQGNGKFAVVADAKKIRIKGGVSRLIAILEGAGYKAEPVAAEAAAALAAKMKWAGKVTSVLRWGGRIVIVVAVAADAYRIYHAQDRVKAVIESVGGWAGATAGAAAFAALWAPADVAGPAAWTVHGVGTLVSGAIGYWVGSEITRTVYELVVE